MAAKAVANTMRTSLGPNGERTIDSFKGLKSRCLFRNAMDGTAKMLSFRLLSYPVLTVLIEAFPRFISVFQSEPASELILFLNGALCVVIDHISPVETLKLVPMWSWGSW